MTLLDSSKLTPVKHSSSLSKAQKLSRSPGLSPHSKDLDKHKDKQGFPSPRTYKWTFQLGMLPANATSCVHDQYVSECELAFWV